MEFGKRYQRSRQAGARMPEHSIYVGRGYGRAGRFGNPFKVGGPTVIALAQVYDRDDWKGRQWSACRLYALWLADKLGTLPVEIAALAAAEVAEDGGRTPPTLEEIRKDLAWSFDRGRDVVCWCSPFVDCHGDILRAVALGRDPVAASGTSPHWADNFRHIEAQRERKGQEIRANIRRRTYVKGWTAW